MRIIRTAMLAGVAALALAGSLAAKPLQKTQSHVMTVQLPGGMVEHIRYSGNVAPEIRIVEPAAPTFLDIADLPSPFAVLQQIALEMDRQAAVLLQQAASIAPQAFDAAGPISIATGSLPPGTTGYAITETISNYGICRQTVEITRPDPSAEARVRSHSDGNCSAAQYGNPPAPTAPVQTHDILKVQPGGNPAPGIQRAAWRP